MFKNKSILFFLSLFATVFFTLLFLALYAGKGTIFLWVNQNHTHSLDIFFIWMTKFGEEMIFIFLGLLLFIFKKMKFGLLILFNGFVVMIVAFVLKFIFKHPRPKLYYQQLNEFDNLIQVDGHPFLTGLTSFPSGHTMGGFALMTLLFLIFPSIRNAIFFMIVATLVGLSRIYLGHHFLEDVVFGSICGVLVSFAFIPLLNSYSGKKIDLSLKEYLNEKRSANA